MNSSSKIINGKTFVSPPWASKYIGTSDGYIRNLIKRDEITHIKTGRTYFVCIEEIISMKESIDQTKTKYYTVNEASNLLNLSMSQVQHYCKDGTFCDSRVMLRSLYISKSEVNEYVENQVALKEDNYDLREIADILEITIEKVSVLLRVKNRFPGKFQLKSKWYVPKKEVHDYQRMIAIDTGEYLTVSEAHDQYGISKWAFRKWAQKLPNTKKNIDSLGDYLIYRKDIEDYISKNEYKKEHSFIDDPQKAYHYFLEVCNDEIKSVTYNRTIELYSAFALDVLKKSKSRNLKTEVYRLTPPFRYLATNIKKEIFLYSDSEIEDFLKSKNLVNSGALTLMSFFKYCQKQLRNECSFKINLKRKSKYNSRENRELIPEDIFMQYYVYVTDLDYHVNQAIKQPRHVQLWIYIMMHLFEAWRAEDIILELPPINLDEIGVFELDYFVDNKMSEKQAQIVLCQYYVHEFIVNKTGAINAFNVPESMVKPLGTALVIAEIHRRKQKQDNLLYLFKVNKPRKYQYKKFFNGNEELAVFGNLKACRTLMTLFYEYVSEKSDCQELAHDLARKLRSHKLGNDKFKLTDTPGIYIQDSNSESKAKNLSKHLFERGQFGWLYYILLKVVNDDVDFGTLSLETKTQMIVDLQQKQSPFQIEGLGKFLLTQQEKKLSLITEIKKIPKVELLNKIGLIYQGIMPSEIPEAQCFKYGECPYKPDGKRRKRCRRCKYLIPNKYFLVSLKTEIYDLIKMINDLEDFQNAEEVKLKTILFDCMSLLQEALDEEYGLGEETVDAFIDRQDLLSKLTNLK